MSRIRIGLIALGRAVASASLLTGQLTPEQALDRRRLGELDATADGRLAAFTVTEPARGALRPRHVFLYRAGGAGPTQFTWSAKSEWSPRFAPDGSRLAFLSDRGERTSIWIMRVDGGEATEVPTGKIAIDEFAWAPDGRSIAFLGAPPKTEAEEKRAKEKNDARVVGRDSIPALWIVDLDSKAVRRLTRPPWRISEIGWLPGGDRLALLATDSATRDRWTDRLFTIGAHDTVPAFLAPARGPIDGLRPRPGGVAYRGPRDDGPTSHDLWYQPADGGPARNLTAAALDRPVRSFRWTDGARGLAIIDDGFGSRIVWVGLDGRCEPGPDLPVHQSEAVPMGDGGILFIGERTGSPEELWLADRTGKATAVSALNASARAVAAIEPQLLRYRSFDRREIEAALLIPRDRAPGQRLPLVVLVHGGPTGAWRDAFEPWGQLLAARGYAVLYPNVRGSTGYGWDFVIANRGDWGGGDFKDLMVGVDTVIARGIADPERLGIAGWSYGGYMASWAITQTDRFKAAVTGAGMSDLAVEYGTERSPAYDEWFYGTPYERPDGFRKSSPLTYIARAKTPTLILQGEEDVTDPISQSQMLHRALLRYNVPTELVLYPREGHGIREEKHALDRLKRVVDWFDRWLGSPAR